MGALFVKTSVADSSAQNWNRIGQLFWGNFFRCLGNRQGYLVLVRPLSMVDWTNDSERRSGTIKTTAFFASAMRLWGTLVTESKKRPMAARWLGVVSLDGVMSLVNGGNHSDQYFICWT